jgi:hypothetical protein
VPQLNIYIPEDLAEVLPRHRGALNLSQVCTRALRQEVQKMGMAAQPQLPAGVNIPRVLARLRDEQQRQSTAFRDGAADAAHWLEEEASADEIRRFAEWTPAEHILLTPIVGGSSDPDSLSTKLQGKHAPPRGMLKSDWFHRRAEQVKASGVDEHSYWVAYFKGWQHTVAATWSQIRDQLVEERSPSD